MDMNYIVYGVLGVALGGIVGYFTILIKKVIDKKTIIKRIQNQTVQHFYTQKPGTEDTELVEAIELKSLGENKDEVKAE